MNCTCKSKLDARRNHYHVSVEVRNGKYYGVWADAERPPRRTTRGGLNKDGTPRRTSKYHVRREVLAATNERERERWARDKSQAVVARLGQLSQGAPRLSDESLELALARFLATKTPYSDKNKDGRSGPLRPPPVYASAEAKARYTQWAGNSSPDPKAPKPLTDKTYAEVKTTLTEVCGWLAAAGATKVSGIGRAQLVSVEQKIETHPKKGGGKWGTSTADLARKRTREFFRWLGPACPASAHLDVIPVPPRITDRPGVADDLAQSMPFNPDAATCIENAEAAERDALDREIMFARTLLQSALHHDMRLTDNVEATRAAPFASLLLLTGARPIEVHKLEPEHVRLRRGTNEPFIHFPGLLTKTGVARTAKSNVSPALDQLLRALMQWCAACAQQPNASADIVKQACMLGGLTPGSRLSTTMTKALRSRAKALGYPLRGDIWKRCRSLTQTVLVASGMMDPEQAALRGGHGAQVRFASYVRQIPMAGKYATLEAALHIEDEVARVIAAVQQRTLALAARAPASTQPASQAQAAE